MSRPKFWQHDISLKKEEAQIKAAGMPEADEVLHLAAIRNTFRRAEQALKAGADPERTGPLGYRALERAMRRKRYRVVSVLVAHAIERAERNEPDRDLLQAALQGDEVEATAALEAGASINTTDADGSTALTTACRLGHGDLVDRLLEIEGIDLDAQDSGGSNPLSLATLFLQVDRLKTLLRAGADPERVCVQESGRFIREVDRPEHRTLEAREMSRLLGQARAGILPPDPLERYPSHKLCRICREIPARVLRNDSREFPGDEESAESTPRASYWFFVARTSFQEVETTHRPHTSDKLYRCPLCETNYSWSRTDWDEPYDPFPIDTEEMKRLTRAETDEWMEKIAKLRG